MKDLSSLIGRIAVTDSEMSPKGTVLIDDEVYEAVTDGEYIDPGRGVKVTRVKGKEDCSEKGVMLHWNRERTTTVMRHLHKIFQ